MQREQELRRIKFLRLKCVMCLKKSFEFIILGPRDMPIHPPSYAIQQNVIFESAGGKKQTAFYFCIGSFNTSSNQSLCLQKQTC